MDAASLGPRFQKPGLGLVSTILLTFNCLFMGLGPELHSQKEIGGSFVLLLSFTSPVNMQEVPPVAQE